ncbi:PREDICTED: olfactory receptor 6F1-like [Nanorana parkeri]|uniref:olfactory receptor 6F1-like n=1 Tax=Nanorana parkeri TaxID=125878 RepID=UPI00085424A3|nr:PREDICTED: olfactory receptor 6F1-like [Nanorana parkeri]
MNINILQIKCSNHTRVSDFFLVGFSMVKEAGLYLFVLIFIIYIISITANVFVIVIIANERRLHKPMYFFIGALSFLEIWYPSVTVPRLLWALFTEEQSISPIECFTQFFFHFSFGAIENFLLTVMALDRYAAICNPLHYSIIMSPNTCILLLLGSWLCGFLIVVIPCFEISQLSFCGCNIINHYYCDFAPLIKLSCSETSHVEKMVFVSSCFVILGCFLIIIMSYIWIIKTTLSFSVSFGRSKTFSTCASHLIVVVVFYTTTIFMFVRPRTGDFLHLNKIISVIPSIITPLLNPIIYTLRNKEVKEATWKTTRKWKGYHI